MCKKIGIVGGMGPLATAKLFELIVENTASNNDSEHIRIFIDNNPQIPDRTQAVLYNGRSPVPAIVDSARSLIDLGADFILLPCNTSHYFYDEIQSELNVPVLNMIELTSAELKKKGIKKVGLLATEGTVKSKVYEKYNALYGIQTIVPDEEDEETVMDYIYNKVKAGRSRYDYSGLHRLIDRLKAEGVNKIILGCTELSADKDDIFNSNIFIDASRVLALKAIEFAGYQIRTF